MVKQKGQKQCSDDFPARIIDSTAETIQEMAAKHPEVGESAIRALVKRKVAAGEWEQVFKQNHMKQLVRAYRVTVR